MVTLASIIQLQGYTAGLRAGVLCVSCVLILHAQLWHTHLHNLSNLAPSWSNTHIVREFWLIFDFFDWQPNCFNFCTWSLRASMWLVSRYSYAIVCNIDFWSRLSISNSLKSKGSSKNQNKHNQFEKSNFGKLPNKTTQYSSNKWPIRVLGTGSQGVCSI